MLKDKKYDWMDVAVFVTFSIFFLFLLLTGEPLFLGDTDQYLNQYVMREPIYSLLLQIMGWITKEYFAWFVILFQNVLAIVANAMFVRYLRKTFTVPKAFIPLIVGIMLAPHIATPLASESHFVLTNSLLTEGITFSVYLFFVKYIMEMLWSGSLFGKNTWYALAWAVVMSLIRGQFMTLLVVWLLVGIYKALFGKKKQQSIIFLMVFVLTFFGRGLLVKGYNYCEQGMFVGTASGKTTAFANVLYVADREDGEAITDETLRQLFYTIYDAIYDAELNYSFAPNGVIEKGLYQEMCHDSIKFDYFLEITKSYIGDTKGIYVDQYQQLMIEADEIAAQMQKSLLPEVLGRYVSTYISIMILGFIRSIAFLHPILNWYTLCAYFVVILMVFGLWRKNHQDKSVMFMLLVLLMLVGNVSATGLFIMCLSRYVLYNFSLFYIAGLLMLVKLLDYVRIKRK